MQPVRNISNNVYHFIIIMHVCMATSLLDDKGDSEGVVVEDVDCYDANIEVVSTKFAWW